MGRLVHTGLGSLSLLAHVLHYPPLPHANGFVIGTVVINKNKNNTYEQHNKHCPTTVSQTDDTLRTTPCGCRPVCKVSSCMQLRLFVTGSCSPSGRDFSGPRGSLSRSLALLSLSLFLSFLSLLLPTTLLPMSGNARHVFSLAAPLVATQCKARLMCHDLLCHTQGKSLLMHMIVASALTWF